jgi:hypothetical protein
MTREQAWSRKTKQRDLDVERALRSQLRRANDLLAQEQARNADMLAALRDAEKRLRGAGMLGGEDDLVRAAIAKATAQPPAQPVGDTQIALDTLREMRIIRLSQAVAAANTEERYL